MHREPTDMPWHHWLAARVLLADERAALLVDAAAARRGALLDPRLDEWREHLPGERWTSHFEANNEVL